MKVNVIKRLLQKLHFNALLAIFSIIHACTSKKNCTKIKGAKINKEIAGAVIKLPLGIILIAINITAHIKENNVILILTVLRFMLSI
jgi:hypothetical protein